LSNSDFERLTALLKGYPKKIIETGEIQRRLKTKDYLVFYALVSSVIEKNLLSPVKNSGLNGMQPELFNRYRILSDDVPKIEGLKKELLTLNPRLDLSYYQKHMDHYQSDRDFVRIYHDFFEEGTIPQKIERRELSFLLFSEEKWLEASTQPYKVLKRLGLDLERDFNCFDRRQPFTYFPFSPVIRNILIVENLTPFSDLFLILKQMKAPKPFDAIVFGSGKHIIASFSFFDDLFEDISRLRLFYWGDIDITGLNIYFSLKTNYTAFDLKLWERGYQAMVDINRTKPEATKTALMAYSPTESEKPLMIKLKAIIANHRVIPQETVNYSNLERLLCL